MRFLAIMVCLLAVFAFGVTGEGFATERRSQDGEKNITEHGHHGGGGRRGGRGWGHGGGYYDGGYYHH